MFFSILLRANLAQFSHIMSVILQFLLSLTLFKRGGEEERQFAIYEMNFILTSLISSSE